MLAFACCCEICLLAFSLTGINYFEVICLYFDVKCSIGEVQMKIFFLLMLAVTQVDIFVDAWSSYKPRYHVPDYQMGMSRSEELQPSVASDRRSEATKAAEVVSSSYSDAATADLLF